MTSKLHLALLGGLLIGAVACDRAPTPSSEPASATPKAPEAKADGYSLTVKDWEGPTGEEGYVVVTVQAKDGHKINADYPHKVSMEQPPEGLNLPMRTMKRGDAEIDGDRRMVFSIPTLAHSDGEYALKGEIKLSVCSADTCQIAKEKLAARVVAQ